MKLLRYIFIALALPVCTQAGAQTLADFIATGLENNYNLKIARNEEAISANNATYANAGYLPTVNATAGYSGTVDTGAGQLGHGVQAGVNAEWTVFDGFKIQATYAKLQELKRQGATRTRLDIEDYVATLTAEYYNLIQQKIRMRNLNNAVKLSKERLRIVLERYSIGSASRLDLQQAQVDFNADSAKSLKQHELMATSRIRLYELMAVKDMQTPLVLNDSAIDVDATLTHDSLLEATMRLNAELLDKRHNIRLAELDYKATMSRDYPYIKLNAGYNYQHTIEGNGRGGVDFGVKVGYNIFDGKRTSQKRNAQLNIENADLARMQLEQSLRSDLADLWQAYKNNLRLLSLERENLVTAQENHYIAHERYMLGSLSGIEMREAQQSLLDAEERILEAQYNTKLCEISLRQISGDIMRYMK